MCLIFFVFECVQLCLCSVNIIVKNVEMCAQAAGWVSMWCRQLSGGSVCSMNVGVDSAVMLLGEERGPQPGTTSLLL